jgi:hypothetical protein
MTMGDAVAFWRKQFELGGNDPSRWADKAYALLTAANVIDSFKGAVHEELMDGVGERTLTELEYQRVSVSGVGPMLRAMATECYLKALWLQQGNELVKNGSYAKVLNKGNEHQLDVLASEVAKAGTIAFDANELALLSFVSKWIVAGRYPIPRHYTQLSVLDRDAQGRPMQRSAWPGDPEAQLSALIDRLQNAVGFSYSFAEPTE